LAAPRLDQGAAEELVHEPCRFEVARGEEQAPRVGARTLPSKGDSPFGQHAQDGAKVLEFLACEPGERLEKRRISRAAEKQRHRGPGGLLLAVGVIDEDLVELPNHPRQPVGTSRRNEAEHVRTILARIRGSVAIESPPRSATTPPLQVVVAASV